MTRKTVFFEKWSWFKFSNFGLALGTNLKFYTSVAKGLKVKVRMFWGLVPTFVEVIREKLVGRGAFCPTPILNRVKSTFFYRTTPVVSSDTSYIILNAILLYGNFCQGSMHDALRDLVQFVQFKKC